MNKDPQKIGVGQRAFTFGLDPKNARQETQDNGACASPTPSPVRSKPERKHKGNALIDKVSPPSNLGAAWERVRENGGAAGVDGVRLQHFGCNVEERLSQRHTDLRPKT